MTLDHIIPQSAYMKTASADEEGNLCVACKSCNNAKAAMSISEFRKWVNVRNNELLKLESDRRAAIARAEELSRAIAGKRFTYIHYLRKVIIKV